MKSSMLRQRSIVTIATGIHTGVFFGIKVYFKSFRYSTTVPLHCPSCPMVQRDWTDSGTRQSIVGHMRFHWTIHVHSVPRYSGMGWAVQLDQTVWMSYGGPMDLELAKWLAVPWTSWGIHGTDGTATPALLCVGYHGYP